MNNNTKIKELIYYIENDSMILMPIDEFFNDAGEHITKKEYGKVLLKYLCIELRDKFITTKTRG